MFGDVLFPVDLSPSMERLVRAAEEVVVAGVRRITLFHVVDRENALAEPETLEYSRKTLEEWKTRLEQCRPAAIDCRVAVGTPWIAIVHTAAEEGYSFILLGSHSRALVRPEYLGAETENVLHHASVPVLLVRMHIVQPGEVTTCLPTSATIFRRVLFPIDFSPDSLKCIPLIEQMADARPAELIVAHIQDTRTLAHATAVQMEEFNRRDARRLEDLKVHFESLGFGHVTTLLRTGDAIEELLAIARDDDISLIVLGAKGRTNLASMALGGVSETLVHRSGSHILLVR
ncbi:MAG: universal stress protein [Methanomicrobiales archaeon]|nr:universal stress protein [Methanomicrobiales archaeon]